MARSPTITGLDEPEPGKSTFQTMLLVSFQVVGTDSLVRAAPFGPKNSGQSPACRGRVNNAMQMADRMKRSMGQWFSGAGGEGCLCFLRLAIATAVKTAIAG